MADRRILVFVCNWCSLGGADQAGGLKLVYPETIRLVRVMCSGRVDPQMVLKAFRDGADGVIEQRLTMKKGDEVRIRKGVFSDLVGILEKPVSAAGRVRVLLNIMRYRVRCELSAADVERITE